jgi:hypothetical protein
MKKVLRLSESDLMRIVKRIVNETTLTEQVTPETIKGFIQSTKAGARGGPTSDFVVIKVGKNMKWGDYYDSVIIQTNIKDPKFKVGTKGTVHSIDFQQRTCEFRLGDSSSGDIKLVDVNI